MLLFALVDAGDVANFAARQAFTGWELSLTAAFSADTGGAAVASNPASVDARVCAVRYDERDDRRRSYSDACQLLEEPSFRAWPIQAPRTARWLTHFVRDHVGTHKLRIGRFMLYARVPDTSTSASWRSLR